MMESGFEITTITAAELVEETTSVAVPQLTAVEEAAPIAASHSTEEVDKW